MVRNTHVAIAPDVRSPSSSAHTSRDDQRVHGQCLKHGSDSVRIFPLIAQRFPVFRDRGPIVGRHIGRVGVGPEHDLSRSQSRDRDQCWPEHPWLVPRHDDDDDGDHRYELYCEQVGQPIPPGVYGLHDEILIAWQVNFIGEFKNMRQRAAQCQSR